jgi:hypothetical protein
VSDDPCAPIHEILARLRRDYEKACEPWLKMLADYAAARPPAPFIVPADQPDAALMTADERRIEDYKAMWKETRDLLRSVAAIAHDGGLYPVDPWQALTAIRKLSLPCWDSDGTQAERKARVAVALGAADQQSARKGLDELTRMAQEDGLYDMPPDKT